MSDYTLYSIGVLDPSELTRMVEATMTPRNVDVPDNDVTFTYEDALNKSFKVLSPSETYRVNSETGGWTDMSDDAEFMAQKVADGLDLKIVGVVRPNETADSNALSAGVAYTHGLTEELMARAASSDIVRQQLADPNTDVFTGKSFDELQDEAKKGVDLGSLFSVDQAKLRSAFTFDTSKLGGVDLSGIDMTGVSIDPAAISSSLDVSALVAGAPAPDFSPIFGDADGNIDPALTADQIGQIVRLAGQLTQGFVTWWGQNGTTTDPSDPNFNAIVGEKFKEYLATDEAQQILGQISAIAGPELAERVQQIATDYVQNQLAPYLQDFFSKFAEQVSDAVSEQLQASKTQAGDDAGGRPDGHEPGQPPERVLGRCECLPERHQLQHGRRGPDLAHVQLIHCQREQAYHDSHNLSDPLRGRDDPISISPSTLHDFHGQEDACPIDAS